MCHRKVPCHLNVTGLSIVQGVPRREHLYQVLNQSKQEDTQSISINPLIGLIHNKQVVS